MSNPYSLRSRPLEPRSRSTRQPLEGEPLVQCSFHRGTGPHWCVFRDLCVCVESFSQEGQLTDRVQFHLNIECPTSSLAALLGTLHLNTMAGWQGHILRKPSFSCTELDSVLIFLPFLKDFQTSVHTFPESRMSDRPLWKQGLEIAT